MKAVSQNTVEWPHVCRLDIPGATLGTKLIEDRQTKREPAQLNKVGLEK
jgi:hypothetical protein